MRSAGQALRELIHGLGFAIWIPAFAGMSGLIFSPALADEPDPSLVPPVGRYELTQAYIKGGAAARDGLLAEMSTIPGADPKAVELGPHRDGNGDFDEVHIRLEVDEIQEEVYPGEWVTFWVYAPLGSANSNAARLPSPTIRVQQGDHVYITLYNTHYLPHTIHLHGLNQSAAMDGAPMDVADAVQPGHSFTYDFVAGEPGTYWYHCHVQEQVHVPMGMAGMFIIEPRRPGNHFARLVMGAGRIYSMGQATAEHFANEYSLVYQDVDERLNRIPAFLSDPRQIERRMHRDYDATQRKPDIFLLNGRAFPFTLQDTPITLKAGQDTKLRVLNAGGHVMALHTHGHHPILTDVDGRPVPKAAQLVRDVFEIAPAQRIDLDLKAGSDGYYASGPGAWMLHDHVPEAATNRGIAPGGDHTMMTYEGFQDSMAGMPGMAKPRYLIPGYYQGKVPVFDPSIGGADDKTYGQDAPVARLNEPQPPRLDLIDAERHRVIAKSCSDHARTVREVTIKAGRQFARPGQAYAFSPSVVHVGRCEQVNVTLENTDEVRHDLMIPGLDPMFALNFVGPGVRKASFLTPDEDVTLPFHCHVPAHDKMGMQGAFIVGKGGRKALPPLIPVADVKPGAPPAAQAPKTFTGEGEVLAVIVRSNRVVINHGPIPGYMAAMEMAYPVTKPDLLQGLNSGDQIRFVIDPAQAAITDIKVLQKAPAQ